MSDIRVRHILFLVALLQFSSNLLAQDSLLFFFPKVQHSPSSQVGIAIGNDSPEPATLDLLFVSDSGLLLGDPALEILLPAGTQESWTLPELFGDGAVGQEGFVLGFSDNIAVVGFFLTYSPEVSQIDGAEATPQSCSDGGCSLTAFTNSILFPELFSSPGQETEFTVLYYADQRYDLIFELVENGAVSQSMTVPAPASQDPLSLPFALVSRTLSELFNPPISKDAFVRVRSDLAFFLGYEEFRTSSARGGRNAIPTPSARPLPFSLFGAQAAATTVISTELTLINGGDATANLTINAFSTGAPAVSTGKIPQVTVNPTASLEVTLPPDGVLKGDLKALLNLQGDFEGWLRVDSDVTGVIGNATFGDKAGNFLSSVQLQASPVQEIVFSHVADGLGFFTGVTLLNFRPDPSQVTIEVFRRDGTRSGSNTFTLKPLEHRPDLLSQLVPGLVPQVEGLIRVRAPLGVFTFELFGYNPQGPIRALSAVPPQRGNGLITGRISPTEAQSLPLTLLQSLRAGRQVFPRDAYPASRSKNVFLDPKHPVRPGEVIVKYRSGSGPSTQSVSGQPALRTLQSAPGNVYLLRSDAVKTPSLVRMATLPAAEMDDLTRRTFDLVETLNLDPNVEFAQPNYIYQAMRVPNDTFFPFQWHYSSQNLEAAWELTTGSPDIVVAVIDTGAKFGHPDLAPRLNGGQFDFISDPQVALDGDGIDADAEDLGDDPNGLASSFHGTHVAGTIGAVTNNSRGVAGVNWSSPLMTLRVLGAGGGSSFDIAQAVLYAARLPNSSGQLPAKAARVINMSLGGPGAGPVESNAVTDALGAGAIIVAAAGNENSDQDSYPAAFPGVISIGALDRLGNKAPYSNYGPNLDFMAPGGNTGVDTDNDGFPDGVLSTVWDESDGSPDYDFYQGTSMATPHAAGVISLMLSANPNLGREQVETILRDTAIDLGNPGRDDLFGHGAIEAFGAVAVAAQISATDPVLVVSPTLLSFGSFDTELGVKLINTGGGQLLASAPVVETDGGGSWLNATLSTPSGPMAVRVNRAGLADGDYSGRVRLTSNGGNAVVEVRMRVGVKAGEDIGDVYVIALDPRTFENSGQGIATFGGLDDDPGTPGDSYSYRTLPIPAGTFVIVAGTDLDGDNFICDEGEFCGYFPVSNQPIPVGVSSGMMTAGIDFIVEREAPIGPSSAGLGLTDRGLQLRWVPDLRKGLLRLLGQSRKPGE